MSPCYITFVYVSKQRQAIVEDIEGEDWMVDDKRRGASGEFSNNNPGCLYGDKEDKIKLKGQLTNSRSDRLLTMHNAVGGKWVIL